MGILQTRILERVAMLSSRGSSWPMDQTQISCLLCFLHWQVGSLPIAPPRTPKIWGESESFSVLSDSLRSHGLYSPGILQARILEWITFPFSRGSSQPRDWTQVSDIAGGFFTSWPLRVKNNGIHGRNPEQKWSQEGKTHSHKRILYGILYDCHPPEEYKIVWETYGCWERAI